MQTKWFHTKGAEASQLRKRKYKIVRRYGLEKDLLPGSLTLTYRSCGKPTCHCATDEGHPMCALSFSLAGKKLVQVIPEQLANELRPLVERGSEHREALAELMRLNAELLTGQPADPPRNRSDHPVFGSWPGGPSTT